MFGIFEAIYDIITSLVSIVISLISFLINSITSMLNFVIHIPDYVATLTGAFGYLPSIFYPFLFATVSVYVILFIIDRRPE